MQADRSVTIAVKATLAFAALAVVACAGGSPVPAGYEAIIADASASLEEEDDLPFTSYLFQRIRCRADGGRLVEFKRGGWFVADAGYAYALQGPGAVDWGGGWGMPTLDDDPEIVYFFSESPEAPCPLIS